MDRFWLRIQAPFAAFQEFQAATYLASAPVMPLSTAYGLVLNLAGIEMRPLTPTSPTGICAEVPALRIAVGLLSRPVKCTLIQQFHSYRIGVDKSAQELAKKTKGAKYWISPIKREVLVDYVGMIGVESENGAFQERVKRGLRGELPTPRYGLLFVGNANCLIDKIELVETPPTQTIWYSQLQETDLLTANSCRLTTHIDRDDSSKTLKWLFVPNESSSIPSDKVWVWFNQHSS
ncbi:MAG: CRISPR-associated protein Cas5 [Acidobacteria bacterium]|nr:CRISPR-associated protein Cas5 [Acidobacteriota bacterium]